MQPNALELGLGQRRGLPQIAFEIPRRPRRARSRRGEALRRPRVASPTHEPPRQRGSRLHANVRPCTATSCRRGRPSPRARRRGHRRGPRGRGPARRRSRRPSSTRYRGRRARRRRCRERRRRARDRDAHRHAPQRHAGQPRRHRPGGGPRPRRRASRSAPQSGIRSPRTPSATRLPSHRSYDCPSASVNTRGSPSRAAKSACSRPWVCRNVLTSLRPGPETPPRAAPAPDPPRRHRACATRSADTRTTRGRPRRPWP